jgi:hypothetical protein
MAVISRGLVLRSNKGSAGSSYGTGSWTPGAAKAGANFWTAIVASVAGSTPNTPTGSGNGATWASQGSQAISNARLTLFSGVGAISAGAFTADFAGQSQTDIVIEINEYAGVATSGQVVQAAGTTATAATSIASTLAPFANGADNGLAAIIVISASDPTIVKGVNWGGLTGSDLELASALSFNVEVSSGAGVDVTFSWTGSHNAAAVGLEILAGIPKIGGTIRVFNQAAVRRAAYY